MICFFANIWVFNYNIFFSYSQIKEWRQFWFTWYIENRQRERYTTTNLWNPAGLWLVVCLIIWCVENVELNIWQEFQAYLMVVSRACTFLDTWMIFDTFLFPSTGYLRVCNSWSVMAFIAKVEARPALLSVKSTLSKGVHKTLNKHIQVSSNCCLAVQPSMLILKS